MVDWNPKVLNESQTCPIVGHQSASICVPVIVIPFAQIGLPQPNAVLILLSLVQWPRRWNIPSTGPMSAFWAFPFGTTDECPAISGGGCVCPSRWPGG